MEATVKYQAGKYQLASEVSRINVHGNQSHCITDHIYRKYCYCKDLLPQNHIPTVESINLKASNAVASMLLFSDRKKSDERGATIKKTMEELYVHQQYIEP